MLLLIDNYDSFTHNLARYFTELGEEVKVVRNDQIDTVQIKRLSPDYLVISPGPCTPDEAGISLEAIETFYQSIPILGVCLGHQAIGQVFGATVCRAQTIMHGKTSNLTHADTPLFDGVANPFTATRYHSLLLRPDSLPSEFKATAWCHEHGHEEIMAIEHNTLPVMGVQFHPESLLTQYGHKLLSNFLRIGRGS